MNDRFIEKKSDTDWKRLHEMRDDEIDVSDIPPIRKDLFKKMAIRMPEPKAAISIRLDENVIAWFKKRGPGYQTRINAVLKSYVEAHTNE